VFETNLRKIRRGCIRNKIWSWHLKELQKITIQEDKLIKNLCTADSYKILTIIIKDLNENYKFKMHIFTVKW